MSAPLMNKIVQENPLPDPFVYMDDSSTNFQDDSKIPAGASECNSPTLLPSLHGTLYLYFGFVLK